MPLLMLYKLSRQVGQDLEVLNVSVSKLEQQLDSLVKNGPTKLDQFRLTSQETKGGGLLFLS